MQKPWEFDEPLCAEVGTEIFFARDAEDGRPASNASYAEAKKICASCVHKIECADWGIKNEKHGVWGGLTPVDRDRIRRKLNILVTPRWYYPLM